MNISPMIAELITKRGIKADHWYNIGAPDATDTEIIKYAIENGYVILTCDLDFSTILSVSHGKKPSVIQLRMQVFNIERTANLILSTVTQNKDALMSGAILSINVKNARVRLLPL